MHPRGTVHPSSLGWYLQCASTVATHLLCVCQPFEPSDSEGENTHSSGTVPFCIMGAQAWVVQGEPGALREKRHGRKTGHSAFVGGGHLNRRVRVRCTRSLVSSIQAWEHPASEYDMASQHSGKHTLAPTHCGRRMLASWFMHGSMASAGVARRIRRNIECGPARRASSPRPHPTIPPRPPPAQRGGPG